MDPTSAREARLDEDEGADMVKPARPYLDVVAPVRQKMDLPLFACNVSRHRSRGGP
jgi:delta-aminolevulinic acid dehydratase/porphobilinogen synthase